MLPTKNCCCQEKLSLRVRLFTRRTGHLVILQLVLVSSLARHAHSLPVAHACNSLKISWHQQIFLGNCIGHYTKMEQPKLIFLQNFVQQSIQSEALVTQKKPKLEWILDKYYCCCCSWAWTAGCYREAVHPELQSLLPHVHAMSFGLSEVNRELLLWFLIVNYITNWLS